MRLLSLLCILALFCGCESHWEGVYYPRGADQSNSSWNRSPYFDTKNECMKWCEEQSDDFYSASASCLCGRDCVAGTTGLEDCRELIDVY